MTTSSNGRARNRKTWPIAIAAVSLLALGACDAGSVVLWPFVEEVEVEPRDPSTLPPPPLEPIDPLDPDAGDQVAENEPETVPNPNANTGAPEGGTPEIDVPENDEVPISDDIPDGPADPIDPVDPLDPVDPVEPPDVSEPDTPPPVVPVFYYYPSGDLQPSSGTGSADTTVFVPDMTFPIKAAPAHPQSQVYRYGGGVKGGDQCDARNFTAPWRDNYCEARSNSSSTPYCSVTGIHLGQDIRVGTREGCLAERSTPAAQRERYAIVAVEDGVISNVGSYSVNVRANGRIYRYMHMNMAKLKVAMGQSVKRGDIIGYVSNDFGGTPTTLHLHFEIKVNTAEHGWQYVPPYTSLVAAYQRRENNPGAEYTGASSDSVVGVASSPSP